MLIVYLRYKIIEDDMLVFFNKNNHRKKTINGFETTLGKSLCHQRV